MVSPIVAKRVYTLTDADIPQRVFKKGEDFHIRVVLYNNDDEPREAKAEDIQFSFRAEAHQREEERVFFDTSLFSYVPKSINESVYVGPKQHAHLDFIGNIPNAGRKYLLEAFLKGETKRSDAWGFYVDGHGPPPSWLLGSGIAVQNITISGGGKCESKSNPYDFYNPKKAPSIFDDLVKAGVTHIFIGPEYYNYGRLEGGFCDKFGHIEGVLGGLAGHLFAWFPTGPTPNNYHYTTPPLDLSLETFLALPESKDALSLLSRFLSLDFLRLAERGENADDPFEFEKRKGIREFVDTAHAKGLKVVAYLDFIGIYNPDLKVQLYEFLRLGPTHFRNWRSTSQYQVGWGRKNANGEHTEQRLELVENMLGSKSGGLARDLNPWNYAVMPDFSDTGPGSYQDYIVSQASQLIDLYGFDGLFFDDLGRAVMNCHNVTLPGVGESILRNDLFCGALDLSAYIFGVDPAQSVYAKSYLGDIRGDLSRFMGAIRDAVKKKDPQKVVISSDYYVPWDGLIAAEDLSSSDQHDLKSKHFARFAYHTYERAYKGLRVDFNPRTEPDLVAVAIAWANRAIFWFGGDKEDLPIRKALQENSFHASEFGKYVDWHKTFVGPLKNLELLHHSQLTDEKNREGKPFSNTGEVKNVGGGDPYFVLYANPGQEGEDKRILHVINTTGKKTDYSFAIRIPENQEISRVRILSPDPEAPSKELTAKDYERVREGGVQYIKLKKIPCTRYSMIEIEPKANCWRVDSFLSFLKNFKNEKGLYPSTIYVDKKHGMHGEGYDTKVNALIGLLFEEIGDQASAKDLRKILKRRKGIDNTGCSHVVRGGIKAEQHLEKQLYRSADSTQEVSSSSERASCGDRWPMVYTNAAMARFLMRLGHTKEANELLKDSWVSGQRDAAIARFYAGNQRLNKGVESWNKRIAKEIKDRAGTCRWVTDPQTLVKVRWPHSAVVAHLRSKGEECIRHQDKNGDFIFTRAETQYIDQPFVEESCLVGAPHAQEDYDYLMEELLQTPLKLNHNGYGDDDHKYPLFFLEGKDEAKGYSLDVKLHLRFLLTIVACQCRKSHSL